MLGLFSAVTLVVGEVIGSGIFLKPAAVDKTIGGYVGLILALWVVCGLVNLCGALALAELAAMFPQEGGTYVFLARSLRPAVVVFVVLDRVLGHPHRSHRRAGRLRRAGV